MQLQYTKYKLLVMIISTKNKKKEKSYDPLQDNLREDANVRI